MEWVCGGLWGDWVIYHPSIPSTSTTTMITTNHTPQHVSLHSIPLLSAFTTTDSTFVTTHSIPSHPTSPLPPLLINSNITPLPLISPSHSPSLSLHSSHSPHTSPLNLTLITDDDPQYIPDEDLISISTPPRHSTPNNTTSKPIHLSNSLTATQKAQLTYHQQYHHDKARYLQTFLDSSHPPKSLIPILPSRTKLDTTLQTLWDDTLKQTGIQLCKILISHHQLQAESLNTQLTQPSHNSYSIFTTPTLNTNTHNTQPTPHHFHTPTVTYTLSTPNPLKRKSPLTTTSTHKKTCLTVPYNTTTNNHNTNPTRQIPSLMQSRPPFTSTHTFTSSHLTPTPTTLHIPTP